MNTFQRGVWALFEGDKNRRIGQEKQTANCSCQDWPVAESGHEIDNFATFRLCPAPLRTVRELHQPIRAAWTVSANRRDERMESTMFLTFTCRFPLSEVSLRSSGFPSVGSKWMLREMFMFAGLGWFMYGAVVAMVPSYSRGANGAAVLVEWFSRCARHL